MSILFNLYSVYLNNQAKISPMQPACALQEKELLAHLNENQRRQFTEYVEMQMQVCHDETKDAFCTGIKMGFSLADELRKGE